MSHLESPTLRRVRLREGYAIDEVDTFLAEVRRGLDGRLPDPGLAARIRDARFSPVRLRPGYDMSEVDDHLEQLETLALEGHSPR
jgi:DivIVA domain-containing protein